MEAYVLTNNNVPAFYALLPEEYHKTEYEDGIVVLGVVKPSEDGEDAQACGTLVLEMLDDNIFLLKWILVSRDYRNQGAGTTLLDLACDIAAQMDMQIYGIFSEEISAVKEGGMYRLFDRYGFHIQERDAKSYSISIGEIGKEEFFEKQYKNSDKIVTLDRVTNQQINALNNTLFDQNIMYVGPISKNWTVNDVSVAYIENDVIMACVLYEQVSEDVVRLAYAYSHNKKAPYMPLLLHKTYQLLQDKYAADVQLVIPCVTEVSQKLVEKLMPSARAELITYSAQIKPEM